MRIYLASRYSRLEELRLYRTELEAEGHEVTSRWLNGNHSVTDNELLDESAQRKRLQFANEDMEDIQRADKLICFTEKPRLTATRGGRHVELGMALAWGLECVIIGPRENVFHCLEAVVVYPSWEAYRNRWEADKNRR